MPELETLILINLIVALAFLVKATTGFGENLVMIPLLLLFLELEYVLPLTLIIVLIADGYLLYQFKNHVNRSLFLRFIIPAIAGIAVGTAGLQYIDESLLKPVLGILVILYALWTLLKQYNNVVRRTSVWMNYLAGFTGGGLSGLLGIGAPPVIAYLEHINVTKKVFRATCIITFTGFDLFRMGSYSISGYFNQEIVINGLSLVPAFIAGSFIGMKIHRYLNEFLFQKVVALSLIGVGISLLF